MKVSTICGRTTDQVAGSGATLRTTREYLGLPVRWLARHLDVRERTVARWEDDRAPVPAFVLDALDELVRRTELVEDDLDDAHSGDAVLWTYRTDADYRADDPDSTWPASWHRAITARLAHDRYRDAAIRYRRPETDGREL